MDRFTLHLGDCIEFMKSMDPDSVDAVVTDPPYHLTSIVKRFGKKDSAPAQFGTDGVYSRHSTGFMGKEWDGGDIAFLPETWAEVLRVAKPGAHLLAFGGTRTFYRMTVAIEDAGWEIRDTLMWIHGQGFPKSHNVGKALDKRAGVEREVVGSKLGQPGYSMTDASNQGTTLGWSKSDRNGEKECSVTAPATPEAQQWDGWGTALKPSWEPIILARKPFDGSVAENVLKYGTGAINIDGCRVSGESVPINKLEKWSGFGQEKQPDYEQEINNRGRWPANVLHDGSEEVLALFPESKWQLADLKENVGKEKSNNVFGKYSSIIGCPKRGDSGSAARFFYCAKTTKQDRDEGLDELEEKLYVQSGGENSALARGETTYQEGDDVSFGMNRVKKRRNTHPTVKPTNLMRYLCRLITPPDGVILDPFMGSGSTGKAAMLEWFNFIGCEKEAEYVEIARKRIEHASGQPRQDGLL